VRSRLAALLLLVSALLVVALALRARSGTAQSPSPRPRPRPAAAAPAGTGRATPVDVDRLRDVFHFADDQPGPAPGRAEAPPRLLPVPTPPPVAEGPRLVGLVLRHGRLAAALALDGEVELALPGDSLAGVSVLAVAEDGVRVRLADGSERVLLPPE
jgi:hypothetical protein